MLINTNQACVRQFLKNHSLCVIGLVGEGGAPQSSLVEFVVDDDLNLYFGTNKKFRKVAVLQTESKASVVVGGYEEACVQIQASVEPLTGDFKAGVQDLLLSRMKQNYFPIVGEEDFVFFKIIPEWIRYTDVSTKPWNVFELDIMAK